MISFSTTHYKPVLLQVEEKKKRDEEQLVTAVFPNIFNIITETSTLAMFTTVQSEGSSS